MIWAIAYVVITEIKSEKNDIEISPLYDNKHKL
jgi:hypothetical protein